MTIKEFKRKRDDKGKYIQTTLSGWKAKTNEYQKTYLKKNPWAKHKMYAQSRSKKLNRSFELTVAECKFIWKRDKAHLLKEPSIDRINSSKGYFLENCRFIEMRENSRLGNISRKVSEKQREASRKNVQKWARNQKGKKRGPYKKKLLGNI